eukprot:sb/3461139/
MPICKAPNCGEDIDITTKDSTWNRVTEQVHQRLQGGFDLFAEEAKYHSDCIKMFKGGKPKPTKQSSHRPPRVKRYSSTGPQLDEEKFEVFSQLMDDLRSSETGTISMDILLDKMANETEPYSQSYVRKLINDRFVDTIEIKNGLITVKDRSADIVRDLYKKGKNEADVVKATGKLIKESIRQSTVLNSTDHYPDMENFNAQQMLTDIPAPLRNLIEALVTTKVKRDQKIIAVCHMIMTLCRPGSIQSPLLLALGISVHQTHRSKHLNSVLASLGMAPSYDTVINFEKVAAVSSANSEQETSGGFLQFAADNVDHNLITLNGQDSLHAMGMVSVVSPGSGTISTSALKKTRVTQQELRELSQPIEVCDIRKEDFFYEVKFSSSVIQPVRAFQFWKNVDCLYVAARSLGFHDTLWCGTMQGITKGPHPGVSAVKFLPIINLDPNDDTCVYSTLKFISGLCEKSGLTPVITFDQPLYLRAVSMTTAKDSDVAHIVVRLGKFHLMLCWLATIGHLFANSGLEMVLGQVYGEKTVEKILAGKQFNRGVRGHTMVHSALYQLLGDSTDDPILLSNEEAELLSLAMDSDLPLSEELSGLSDKLRKKYQNMKADFVHKDYKTGRLWLMYIRMWEIFLALYRAERTGDFQQSLLVCKQMLPYLAAGTSVDHLIESTLMRSFKSVGGLTGTGNATDEAAQNAWLYSWPKGAEISSSIQDFSGVVFGTSSDQHKDSTESRRASDVEDSGKIFTFLSENSPFVKEKELRNIATGEIFSEKVTVYDALNHGQKVIRKLSGTLVKDYSFTRTDQTVTMAAPGTTKAPAAFKKKAVNQEEELHLYQRFITFSVTDKGSQALPIEDVLRHELVTFPPSLFDARDMMRPATKSELVGELVSMCDDGVVGPEIGNSPSWNVFDGGMLIQKIAWVKGTTFGHICRSYFNYLQRIAPDCKVVFDGYLLGSTKDHTHCRRQKLTCSEISPSLSTTLNVKKEMFLANKKNKDNFIKLLMGTLELQGTECQQSDSDADFDICKKAVDLAWTRKVVLWGEDTDLLVILLHMVNTRPPPYDIFIRGRTHTVDVKKMVVALPTLVVATILANHAFLGCDTTSSIYRQGKTKLLKKLPPVAADLLKCFYEPGITKEEAVVAGEKLLLLLVGSSGTCRTLDELRVHKFMTKQGTSCQQLPPTSAAFGQHSLRVYHQVQEWMGTTLDPLMWGWHVKDGLFTPVSSTLPIAPERLLRKQYPGCKCGSDCNSNRCPCRKKNMPCSPVLRGCSCKKIDCRNA